MNHIIKFAAGIEREINQTVLHAKDIWQAANPDWNSVPLRVTAGNYAGYGKYVARCYSTGVIEFSTGNRASVLILDGNRLRYTSREAFLGTLLHEIGHHVVNTARSYPWDTSNASQSTHLRNDWIWICRTGWLHFHGTAPSVDRIQSVLSRPKKDDLRQMLVSQLTAFNPYKFPPDLGDDPVRRCAHCGARIEGKRAGAKYCTASCRVAACVNRKSTS